MWPFSKISKKRRQGKTSQISKLRSPYREKSLPERKRLKKARSLPRSLYSMSLNKEGISHKAKVIVAVLLTLGILSFGVYALFFSDYFLINNFVIEEEGTIIDDYQNMKNTLSPLLGQNLVLANEDQLKKDLKQSHPEMETVKIYKIFPKTIKIQYTKYPTVANIINTVDGIQKRFLIDSQGFLVEENTEQLDLPYIRLTTSEFLTVRENFLKDPEKSKEKLTYIIDAIHLFEEKFGIKVLYAEYHAVERELHLYTEKYFYVIFDMEKNLNRQIEKLKKSLTKIDIYNVPILYIDLRISGTDTEKVIIKRK